MSAQLIRFSFVERGSVIALILVLALRTWQLFALDFATFALGSDTITDYYGLINGTGSAVFILVPLYLVCMLPVVRLSKNVSLYLRFKHRESSTYCFALLAAIKAAVFAVLINATAALLLFLRCPLAPSVADLALISITAAAMELLFFMVCALLLQAVFSCTAKIQLAAAAVLGYAIWDYAADYIPFWTLPRIGWRLTEVGFPIDALEVVFRALPLLAMMALLMLANLILARKKDIVQEEIGAQSNA